MVVTGGEVVEDPVRPWRSEPMNPLMWLLDDDPGEDAPVVMCLMRRNIDTWTWCGYAGVLPGHWAYGLPLGRVPDDVHNASHAGLTYAGHMSGEWRNVPAGIEAGNPWWFGFDTMHADDFMPRWIDFDARDADSVYVERDYPGDADARQRRYLDQTYRTAAYVRERVTAVAAILAADVTDQE